MWGNTTAPQRARRKLTLAAVAAQQKSPAIGQVVQQPGVNNVLITAQPLMDSARQHAKDVSGVDRGVACIGLEQLVGKLEETVVADRSCHQGEHA